MNAIRPKPRRIDCHVHLVGDGSDGTGCFFRLPSLYKKFLARIMLREAGLPASTLKTGLDRGMRDFLMRSIPAEGVDAVMLLAQDLPYDDRGTPLPERAGFFVPNDHLLDVCAGSDGRFIPAVSIHPYRKDACRELERCGARGAKALKLLPNCHNADCNRQDTRDFWKLMASSGMIFLAHTGGEYSVPVLNRAYENPETLRLPLDCGVTCIAAHGASPSAPFLVSHMETLVRMFAEYPHLYCDNSALSTPNRCGATTRLIKPDAVGRVLHGSDFPIPVSGFGPWTRGLMTFRDWRESSKEKNPFARDALVKRAQGYPEETYTRLDALLRG